MASCYFCHLPVTPHNTVYGPTPGFLSLGAPLECHPKCAGDAINQKAEELGINKCLGCGKSVDIHRVPPIVGPGGPKAGRVVTCGGEACKTEAFTKRRAELGI